MMPLKERDLIETGRWQCSDVEFEKTCHLPVSNLAREKL